MIEDRLELKAHSVRPLIRAAQYVRMSTEHQKYSTENQADAIAHYAAARGFEIVRSRLCAERVARQPDAEQGLPAPELAVTRVK
jgi:hypothetical protein